MTRVAVAGLGAVGRALVRPLNAGVPGFELTAVSARDRENAEKTLRTMGVDVPVVDIDDLEPLADVVIECAPANLLPRIARPFLQVPSSITQT
jgi:aspartate dehydrogenase